METVARNSHDGMNPPPSQNSKTKTSVGGIAIILSAVLGSTHMPSRVERGTREKESAVSGPSLPKGMEWDGHIPSPRMGLGRQTTD